MRGALKSARKARGGQEKPRRSLRPYRLCSVRHGLGVLPEALAKSLGDRFWARARVAGVEKNSSSGVFEVKVERQGEIGTIASSTLIVATPAYVATQLLGPFAPNLAALVAEIPYVSIVSVPIAYRVEQVGRKLDGFGFLAPRGEGLRTLGSIWNSTLFDGRSPEGWVCLTNFIGGATDPEAVRLRDQELIRIVHHDLSQVLKIQGVPRPLPITRYERAIPQYTLGHAARVARIESELGAIPGLWIAGNYLRGVSLGDCIKHAERIALEISQAPLPRSESL
jgi:oxygen-dependent protoporphyrinogen oxidase